MKLRDAIEQSIRSFYNGELPEKSIEASGKPFIYTLDYFEDKEEDEKKGSKNGKK